MLENDANAENDEDKIWINLRGGVAEANKQLSLGPAGSSPSLEKVLILECSQSLRINSAKMTIHKLIIFQELQ